MTVSCPKAFRAFLLLAIVGAPTTAARCQTDAGPATDSAAPAAAAVPRGATFDPPAIPVETQRRFMSTAARTAWNYVQRNYSTASGLVRALDTWDYVTIWDVASALAAYHSARGLGLITEADYRRRMDRALASLEAMPLYMDVAYNKTYNARNARMVDRNQAVSSTGYGWSSTDMGRFLVWMKIIARRTTRPRVRRSSGSSRAFRSSG
jgi:hypothetical protein